MKKEIAKSHQKITDQVLDKVKIFRESGDLLLHKGYSAENALKSAYLILSETTDRNKKPVLESCTKESIGTALFNMITQGLSPMKKQCYFIAYGNKLQLQRSYLGAVAIIKRDAGAHDVTAQTVHKGDKFSFSHDVETGKKKITEHIQNLGSLDAPFTAAYCLIKFKDGSSHLEIMTRKQIEQSWNQRLGNGLSDAHKNFPEEMALKTVINRACKRFINTISDENLYDESVIKDRSTEEVNQEIEETQIEEINFEEVKEEVTVDESTGEIKEIKEPVNNTSNDDEDPF